MRALFLLFVLAAATGRASEWKPSGDIEHAGGRVVESVWTLERPGSGHRETIRLHRYAAPDRSPGGPVLLYLPGTNMNGVAVAREPRHSLLLALPLAGIPVYAIDYRTHAVGAQELPDSRFMRRWTSAVFVEDASEALRFAASDAGVQRVFVAGFSRGVSLAYSLASQRDAGHLETTRRVAGLVLLDGSYKRAPRHVPQEPPDSVAALERLEHSGAFASDVAAGIGWETRASLMQAAAADPGGPALPGPLQDESTVGTQVARLLYRAWRPGGLANPIERAGDGVSRVEVLARLLAGYDRYYPAVQDVDGAELAAVADASSSLDDAWGELDIPILNFVSSGMGPDWVLDSTFSAVESGSRDVSLVLLEGYGHLDVLVSERSEAEVFDRMASWMRDRREGG